MQQKKGLPCWGFDAQDSKRTWETMAGQSPYPWEGKGRRGKEKGNRFFTKIRIKGTASPPCRVSAKYLNSAAFHLPNVLQQSSVAGVSNPVRDGKRKGTYTCALHTGSDGFSPPG